MSLGGKQQAFVEEFAIDSNAKQAAIRAGYEPNSAASQASRMLTKDNVLEAVAIARAKLSKKRVATFQQKQEILLNTAMYGVEQDEDGDVLRQRNPSATVAAIKELNTMDGDHEPTKHEHRVMELSINKDDADL